MVRHRPSAGSHGTHVAGIAAGNGSAGDATYPAGTFVGVAPEATIIFVQPASNDSDTTFTDSAHVADAIAYVFAKANDLGLPCVVNMSLGQNGGSHDGESIVERAIDRLLETPGRAMTLAAGNEHTWRGHASGVISPGATKTLHWKFGGGLPIRGGTVPPGQGDRTPNEMEVWYSSRDAFDVVLIDPAGEKTAPISPGQTAAHTFASGDRAFIDSERFSRLNGDARIYVDVERVDDQPLTNGVWLVELTAAEADDGRFDAWIERDLRDGNNNFADQSFFVGADFDPVRTLGTPATSRRAITVANYDHQTLAPSPSSSRGATRDGRTKPELSAPGTNIVSSGALGGRPSHGGPPNPVRVQMSGTSMSAPHVAGIAALLLEAEPKLDAAQLTKILIAAADPPPGVSVFDVAWGYGRVDAERAYRLLTGP